MANCFCKTPVYLDTQPDKEKEFQLIEEDEIQLNRIESGQKYAKFFSKISGKDLNQDLLKKEVCPIRVVEQKRKALSFIKNSPVHSISKKTFQKTYFDPQIQFRSQKLLKNNCVKLYTDINYSSSKNKISIMKNKREFNITIPNSSVAEPNLKGYNYKSPGDRLGIQVLKSVRVRSESPEIQSPKPHMIEKGETLNEDWVKLSLDFPSKTFVPNVFTDVVVPSFNKLKKIIAEEDRKNKIIPGKDYTMNDIIKFNQLTNKIKGMEKLSSFYLSKFKETQYLINLAQIARKKFVPTINTGPTKSLISSSKAQSSKKNLYPIPISKQSPQMYTSLLSNTPSKNYEGNFSTPLKYPEQSTKKFDKSIQQTTSQIKNSDYNRQNSTKNLEKVPNNRIYQSLKTSPHKTFVQLNTKK